MAKAVKQEEKAMVSVEVKFYETNSARKKNEPLGTFVIKVEPREVKPVNEDLKDEELERDQERFARETDAADLALRTDALDKVHSIVGWECVLVARVIEEEG